MSEEESSQKLIELEIPIAICICISYILCSLAIEYYKEKYGTAPWIHESSISCMVGLLVGFVIKFVSDSYVSFNSNFFFYIILPPVIFSAGFNMKKKRFFQYFHFIAFFGLIGTIVNFLLIACGAYLYGKIFSTTSILTMNEAFLLSAVLAGSDEVSAISLIKIDQFPRLGALVFGEGVLNDALSIVLFKTFFPLYKKEHDSLELHLKDYFNIHKLPPTIAMPISIDQIDVSNTNNTLDGWDILASIFFQVFFAIVIGVSCSLLNAYLLKQLSFSKTQPLSQIALIFLFGYLAYSIAEVVNVSGILTIFITAIVLAHYSWYSLSKSAQVTTKFSLGAIASIAEGFAFCYVGLSLWVYSGDQIDYTFAFYMILIVLLARMVTIYGLFAIFSTMFPCFHIPLFEQTGFILGGIVRGCLCWAQVLQVEDNTLLVTTTLIVVMTTTILCGTVLPMFLPFLIASSATTSESSKSTSCFPTRTAKLRDAQNEIEENAVPSQRDNSYQGYQYDSSQPSELIMQTPIHGQTSSLTLVEPSSTILSFPEVNSTPIAKGLLHPDDLQILQKQRQLQVLEGLLTPTTKVAHSIRLEEYRNQLRLQQQATSSPNNRNIPGAMSISSFLLYQWIRFDELIMKPLFGGSETQPDRQQILRETSNLLMKTMIHANKLTDNFFVEEKQDENSLSGNQNQPIVSPDSFELLVEEISIIHG